jgi:hypothetical protein
MVQTANVKIESAWSNHQHVVTKLVLQKKILTACGSTLEEGKRQTLQQATKHTPPHFCKSSANKSTLPWSNGDNGIAGVTTNAKQHQHVVANSTTLLQACASSTVNLLTGAAIVLHDVSNCASEVCRRAPNSKLHSSQTPFGTKLEVMLRLAGLPYTAQMGDCQDTKVAPKQKVRIHSSAWE